MYLYSLYISTKCIVFYKSYIFCTILVTLCQVFQRTLALIRYLLMCPSLGLQCKTNPCPFTTRTSEVIQSQITRVSGLGSVSAAFNTSERWMRDDKRGGGRQNDRWAGHRGGILSGREPRALSAGATGRDQVLLWRAPAPPLDPVRPTCISPIPHTPPRFSFTFYISPPPLIFLHLSPLSPSFSPLSSLSAQLLHRGDDRTSRARVSQTNLQSLSTHTNTPTHTHTCSAVHRHRTHVEWIHSTAPDRPGLIEHIVKSVASQHVIQKDSFMSFCHILLSLGEVIHRSVHIVERSSN